MHGDGPLGAERFNHALVEMTTKEKREGLPKLEKIVVAKLENNNKPHMKCVGCEVDYETHKDMVMSIFSHFGHFDKAMICHTFLSLVQQVCKCPRVKDVDPNPWDGCPGVPHFVCSACIDSLWSEENGVVCSVCFDGVHLCQGCASLTKGRNDEL